MYLIHKSAKNQCCTVTK